MYKIYTSCLNIFLQEHCIRNNTITPEQAVGKPQVWGCIEQLLLNKSILNEVKQKKRNLITIWLDYQKAFDSIPHDWMIQSLRLAKIPEKLIAAIETLTKQWATMAELHGNQSSITSDVINFSNGIFQGDSISVLLFIQSLNPLSYMLGKLKGYNYGNKRRKTVTRNFFVDDLKLYGSTINVTKKQLDLVTQFSKDICMDFGTDKCAYLKIVKGTIVSDAEPLEMNNLTIKSVKEGDTYKYLGIDENISYHGPINKERVSKEYFTRTRKIWSSELSAYNKVIAHNAFAVPVLIPTIGVLDWTIGEIKDIDIKTGKILTLTRNFHPNSDVNRLYMQKSLGGRGLRQVQSSYESRIIAIRQHLINNLHRNSALEYIYEKETNDILRVGQELLQKYNIVSIPNEPPKSISKKFTKADQTSKREHFVQKPLHGYFCKLMDNDNNIDKQQSLAWTKDRFITSDLEGYMGTITEQELPTKYIRNKRDRESGKTPTCNNKCRLCHTAIEDVTHVICNCPEMSARYYLPLRHDRMGKILYTSHIQKHFPETKVEQLQEPESICRIKHMKYTGGISQSRQQQKYHIISLI